MITENIEQLAIQIAMLQLHKAGCDTLSEASAQALKLGCIAGICAAHMARIAAMEKDEAK